MPWSIPVSRSTTAQATAPSTLCTTSRHASSILLIRWLLCGTSELTGGAGLARLCASAAREGTDALVKDGGRTAPRVLKGGGGTLLETIGGDDENSLA